ncbi:MerR family transcriptional regulator [Paenibacillus donghaensis]|uniref:MerR family transcriptional regulator n=1 Tax=Paenibacillus donghaensis TaxID=414771 RepID=A0A2Z2KLJ8_9BACL|nr:MerR family transcriptional regulator [Paenibacillus donghaensis]ASA20851.1 MerR family transcriptional regulator [Paenibacillus donghaensis]
MFRIGDFSKLSNISIRMLRHYDKLGVLIPEKTDQDTGFRYYSAAQLRTVNKIQMLKEMGFSLAIIKEMLSSDGDLAKIRAYFAVREAELQEELWLLNTQNQLLASSLELLRRDVLPMEYHVLVKSIPERAVISARRIIPTYADEHLLWGQLYSELAGQNLPIAAPPYGLAIFHDQEHKDSDVDVEVQLAVGGSGDQLSPGVVYKMAPETRVASITMNGEYDQMGSVFETAAQWMEDNGYRLAGSMFNIYHVSPAQDPDPENWVTEACFPVVSGS